MGVVQRLVGAQERRATVAPVGLDPSGEAGPTRHQAKGAGWRRSSHGLYVPTSSELTVEQRIVEAAATLPEDRGAVTGWAALRWMGGPWFDGLAAGGREIRPIDLAVGDRSPRPQHGIRLSKECLEVVVRYVVEGVPVTSPTRSTAYEMRLARRLMEAVVALDMACFSDLVSLLEMRDYLGTLGIWTGIPQAREALALGDENSWSPMETRIRVMWCLGVHGGPLLTNRPIFDQTGTFVGTPDLIEPSLGLVVEYDGRLHLAGEQRAKDLGRLRDFQDLGLEVHVVVAEDVFPAHRLVASLDAAHARAIRNQRRQTWTVDPPSWWKPTHTVALRRAHVPLLPEAFSG